MAENKRGSYHLSDAASSLSAVVPEMDIQSGQRLLKSAAKIGTATHAHAAHAHGHHHGHHHLLLHLCALPSSLIPRGCCKKDTIIFGMLSTLLDIVHGISIVFTTGHIQL